MSIRPTTQSEATQLKNRLRRCLPSARFEMETLCRLANIEISRQVPTAAVECKRHPRLLINPDFVAQYCKRDEYLFLLVMHELWHVLLAHTRMHPRMTPIQNIAFDAIINAGLMAQFPFPEYKGFFESLNPADQFPHCLLRPPVGWPDDPIYPEGLPDGTTQILKWLYPKRRSLLSPTSLPMYEDVLVLLLKHADKISIQSMPMLLGSYEGQDTINDPLIKEMMGEITKNWRFVPGGRQGWGSDTQSNKFQPSEASENVRHVFASVLRRTLSRGPGRNVRLMKHKTTVTGGNGIVPNPYGDRMIHVRQALGMPETLWAQPTTIRARTYDRPSRAFIYLDVSSSMNSILAQCMYLIRPYVARGQAELYQFSTAVYPMKYADIRAGHVTTTSGTNINCVFEHLFEMSPRVDRVLILTDGMVGTPCSDIVARMETYGARLYIVLPYNCKLEPTIAQMAHAVVTLPPLS